MFLARDAFVRTNHRVIAVASVLDSAFLIDF